MLELLDLATGAPVPDRTSRYATGEAAWALAQLHNLFPDEGWDEPARRVLDYLRPSATRSRTSTPHRGPTSGRPTRSAELAPSGLDEHARRVRPSAGRAVRDARADRVAEGRLAGAVRRPSGPRRRARRVGRGHRRAGARGGGRRAPRRPRPGARGTAGVRRRRCSPTGRSTPPTPPGARLRRSSSRARGSATTSPAWTTSSTPCRGCSPPPASLGPVGR